MKTVTALSFAVLLALSLASAVAVPGDEHWSGEFGVPGVSGTIPYVTATHQGRLYVAGTTLGTSAYLWVWDGIQWSTLGTFYGQVAYVYDLCYFGDSLYAAGTFTNVGGVSAKGLAKWNGSTWSGVDFNGMASALASDGEQLYVAGAFTNAGTIAATNVAAYDGSTWQPLGEGLGNSADYVRCLAIGNGKLFAGGLYTNSGPQAVTNLAQWDGFGWQSVGGGMNSLVQGLAVSGTSLYAVGYFSTAGSIPANGIARWDGEAWSTLGSGFTPGAAKSVAALDNMVFAAGSFTSAGGVNATNFAVWNGSTWAAAGSGLNSAAYGVRMDGELAIAAGNFGVAGSALAYGVAAWDGQTWHSYGPAGKTKGLSASVRALASDGTNVLVGGGFGYAGNTTALRVALYDGSEWQRFGNGLNSNVNALTFHGTNIFAGGDFTGSAGGPYCSRLARWNGTTWAPLTGFSASTVNALASRGNDLIIAGYFIFNGANGQVNWLTRWDGTNFWNLSVFPPDTAWMYYIDYIGFIAMAADENNIYVSGRCSISTPDPTWEYWTNSQNVMRFDGTYMRGLGTGINSNANAIAIAGADVFFGGPFTTAGGAPASGIARWDGAAWHSVGGGIVGRGVVNAMAFVGTSLYAGGTFTNMGGVPVNRIARWDGQNWSALGSGVALSATSGSVSALAVAGNDLYVGGAFRTAGGKAAYYFTRWNEFMGFDETSLILSRPAAGAGSPFQFTVTSIGIPTYVIESTTDFTSWTPVLTNTITPYDHQVPNPQAQPRLFYRARSLP